MKLRFEAVAAIVAFTLSIVFLVVPGPYQMVLFTFVAVPLFVMVGVFYLGHVVRELRRKDVL